MKRTLCALMILMVLIAIPAFAVKPQVSNQYGYDDNTSAAAVKTSNPHIAPMSKAITRTTIDTAINIRSILGTNCRSIANNIGGTADTVQVVYLRGSGTTYALWHGYSLTSGTGTWPLYNVAAADANNRPRYPALVNAPNDVGLSAFQCPRVAYHLQATSPRLMFAYESSSIGDNAWSYLAVSDGSVDYWTPCLTQRNNQLAMSAQDYNGGGNGVIHSDAGGTAWIPTLMANDAAFGTPSTQPALVWLNDTTLMGFVPQPNGLAHAYMAYHISYDKGVTWTGPQQISPEADSCLPQYRGGIWWYDYDAMAVNGVPYVAMAWSDWTNYAGRGCSGAAIFVAHPKNVNNLAAGWEIKHASEMWDTASGLGFNATEPALGADAAGNIYLSYCPFGSSSTATPGAVVRSIDGGMTWSKPVTMITGPNLDPFEISRTVSSNVYAIGLDSTTASNKYAVSCYQIPVADIAAQPVVTEAERYVPPTQLLTPGTRIDSVGMDTVKIDTCKFTWQPGFAFGGTYELTASKTADWSVGASCYDLSWHPDSNAVAIIGMPSTGDWYWKVRSIRPDLSKTAWSGIYKFNYQGAAVNTTQWTNPSGVASQPVAPVYSFAVRAAYPNPAKNLATISFQLPKAGAVSMKVYNIAGQVVKSMDVHGTAGMNTMTLSTKDMSNGVYFYQVNSNGYSATRKLTVVR